MKSHFSFKKAFVVVELIIAIAVMNAISIGAVTKISGAPAKARDAARKAAVNNLYIAIESYLNDNGFYPTSSNKSVSGTVDSQGKGIPQCLTMFDAGGDTVGKKISDHLGDKIPKDPLRKAIRYNIGLYCGNINKSSIDEAGSFYYIPLGDGKTPQKVFGYMVGALLEGNTGNNKGCFDGGKADVADCDDVNDQKGKGGSDKLRNDESQTNTYIQFMTY